MLFLLLPEAVSIYLVGKQVSSRGQEMPRLVLGGSKLRLAVNLSSGVNPEVWRPLLSLVREKSVHPSSPSSNPWFGVESSESGEWLWPGVLALCLSATPSVHTHSSEEMGVPRPLASSSSFLLLSCIPSALGDVGYICMLSRGQS